jgi:hypothetical protein
MSTDDIREADVEKIFVVGKRLDDPGAWELQGVFTTEEKAVAACLGWRYFVGPIELDCPAGDATMDWDGAFYPIAREE